MESLASGRAGGFPLRGFLAVAVLLPSLTGLVTLQGYAAGIYSEVVCFVLFSVLNLAGFGAYSLCGSRAIRLFEQKRVRAGAFIGRLGGSPERFPGGSDSHRNRRERGTLSRDF